MNKSKSVTPASPLVAQPVRLVTVDRILAELLYPLEPLNPCRVIVLRSGIPVDSDGQ